MAETDQSTLRQTFWASVHMHFLTCQELALQQKKCPQLGSKINLLFAQKQTSLRNLFWLLVYYHLYIYLIFPLGAQMK